MSTGSTAELDALVSDLEEVERSLAELAARRVALLAEVDAWAEREAEAIAASGLGDRSTDWSPATLAHRTASSEVGAALRIPGATIAGLVHEATVIVRDLPRTFEALQAGVIGYRHASKVADQATPLSSDDRRMLDERLAPELSMSTAAQLNARARRLREQLHPESMVARSEAARERRRVSFEPEADGMGWLSAYLPVDAGTAIMNRIGDLARALAGPGEKRTTDQRRADVLRDLLVDGEVDGYARGIRATVAVTVPVMTLLGTSVEPGSLEGQVPIDAETARRLAAHAPSFLRLLTHPETGAVLSLGRTVYKPPADLVAWLRVRDEYCRHPGCRQKAISSDIDHTIAREAGGGTDHDNLGHLCRPHHRLKHLSAWTLTQPRPGVFRWISPTGRVYEELPEGLAA